MSAYSLLGLMCLTLNFFLYCPLLSRLTGQFIRYHCVLYNNGGKFLFILFIFHSGKKKQLEKSLQNKPPAPGQRA